MNGDGYSGNDLPNYNYRYGAAVVYKRSASSIRIILCGGGNESIAYNDYVTSWSGWKICVTNSDLFLNQKRFTSESEFMSYAESLLPNDNGKFTYAITGPMNSESTIPSWSSGFILKNYDTVNIVIIDFFKQTILINNRSRSSAWQGWKKFEGIAIQ